MRTKLKFPAITNRPLRAAIAAFPASLVLALMSFGVQAAPTGSRFDSDWIAASSGDSKAEPEYSPRLQHYFDTHRGYRDCDVHLSGGKGVRMLLRFDAHGAFRTEGELANAEAERCLAEFFTVNPLPLPVRVPLVLPFWFE